MDGWELWRHKEKQETFHAKPVGASYIALTNEGHRFLFSKQMMERIAERVTDDDRNRNQSTVENNPVQA